MDLARDRLADASASAAAGDDARTPHVAQRGACSLQACSRGAQTTANVAVTFSQAPT